MSYSVDMKLISEQEIWKDVVGYEGMYFVSSLGRVASAHGNGFRILNPGPSSYGYLRVNLSRYGKTRQIKVHRLVATAFIPNPGYKSDVNHKNCLNTDPQTGPVRSQTFNSAENENHLPHSRPLRPHNGR